MPTATIALTKENMMQRTLRFAGDGFPPHPHNASLFTLRVQFGPAFAEYSSMNRAKLIETLRHEAAALGDILPAHILLHIAGYMQSYADQLSSDGRHEYLNGIAGPVVENFFYRDNDGETTFDTATGCSFSFK